MNLALTSDFPSTPNRAVVARIQSLNASPRIAWISPTTAQGRERFPAAQALFRSFGVPRLEYCDIDEEPNDTQFAQWPDYDVLYLTGGDPLVFRDNLHRRGLVGRLCGAVTSGQLVVGASGGAMQLTKSVSVFRLLAAAVEDVIGTHSHYGGLEMVDYEVLPHLGRHDPSFLAKVRQCARAARSRRTRRRRGADLRRWPAPSVCGTGTAISRRHRDVNGDEWIGPEAQTMAAGIRICSDLTLVGEYQSRVPAMDLVKWRQLT